MRALPVMAFLSLSLWICGLVTAQSENPPGRGADGAGDRQAERAPGDKQKKQRRAGRQRGAEMDLDRMLKRLDKDGDGRISQDEAPPRLQRRLNELDTNGDGQCDKAELQAAINQMADRVRRGEKGAKGKGAKGGKGPKGVQERGNNSDGAGAKRSLNADRFLQRLDKNSDGEVSKDEVPERLQQRFEQVDTNGDGSLDKSELQGIVDRMQKMRGSGGKAGKGGRANDRTKPQRPKRPEVDDGDEADNNDE